MKKFALLSLIIAAAMSLTGCILEPPNQMPPEMPELPEVEMPVLDDEGGAQGNVYVPAYDVKKKVTSVSDGVTPFDKSELSDLRQFYLEDHVGVLEPDMALALKGAGLSDEQVDLMAKAMPLSRMGYDLANNLDGSYYFLSGFTYDSFTALVNQLFTEYATFEGVPAHQMFDAQNINGQLKLKNSPAPTKSGEFYKLEFGDVNSLFINFDLYIARKLTIEPFTDDVIAEYGGLTEAYEAYNAANNYLWGENLYSVEKDEAGTVKLIYKYHEEMSIRGGVWKFDGYEDWRW